MLFEIAVLFSSILTIILVKKLTSPSKRPLFNIYQVPRDFYWFKVLFIYIILSFKKLRPAKLDLDRVEKPQELSLSDKPIDGVYFNGANESGDFLITGMARRKSDLIDGFMYLKLKEFGVLETPKLPKTNLKQGKDETGHEAEGIKIRPIEPMRKWKVEYSGKMKDSSGVLHDVIVDLVWKSYMPYFNYDTDMDPFLMAKAMAKEKWSKEYFETLKHIHQTHYEQPGDMKGTVTVDNKVQTLCLNTLRDHSYGYQRDWRNFHRYGLHFLTVENGDRICVGMISMPIAFSSLYAGYIYSKEHNKIYPIQECDLVLSQHGENGTPPKEYAFTFEAGKKRYEIEVAVQDAPAFYISKDCESKIFEQMCTFRVNGKKGWGAAEWQYRNITGKIK